MKKNLNTVIDFEKNVSSIILNTGYYVYETRSIQFYYPCTMNMYEFVAEKKY